MRVGLVFGGRSVEHRVSVVSARTVAKALEQAGHEVVPLGIAQDGCWQDSTRSRAALAAEVDVLEATGGSVAESLSRLFEADVQVVFPIVHGTWGEDGTLQGLFEMANLAYVGANVTASAVAMDKLQCKRVLQTCNLPVVDFEAVRAADFQQSPERSLAAVDRLGFPIFVKPSRGGSSVGVQRITAPRRLAEAVSFALQFDEAVVVEAAIVGRELECSVLGDESLEASAVGEIVPGNEFYDYEDKYLQDRAELRIPAELPQSLEHTVRRMAVDSVAAIGGAGMARVDFLLDSDGTVYVNEINTLPGFTRISMYPKLWEASGVPLPALVDRLVEIARARHQRRAGIDRSIKQWLARVGGDRSGDQS